MVLLSLGRLFLLLSACALLLAHARPTFKDRLDAIKANHHHSVAHTHPADKHTKAHVSKDQGKLETGSDSAENDDDAASSDNDDGATSSGEESSGANASTGAGGGPNIRSGILTTCIQPNHFAMTFDDGPYEYTDALIDLLISENVVATFFVNGKNYWSGNQINPAMKKAYDNGNEIGSHTFTHARISKLSNEQIKKEMYEDEKAIFGAIQKYPAVMRPPYGDVTEKNAAFLNSLGYTVVTWSIDIKDWEGSTSVKDEENTVASALQNSGENNIILQHDVYNQTAAEFAPKLIAYVKSKKLKFVTVSECLGVDAYKSTPIQL